MIAIIPIAACGGAKRQATSTAGTEPAGSPSATAADAASTSASASALYSPALGGLPQLPTVPGTTTGTIATPDASSPRVDTYGELGNGVDGGAMLVESSAGHQTWSWTGAAWRLVLAGPPVTANSRPVFDPSLGKTIMMADGIMGYPLQTWAWDGSSWSNLHASPPGVSGPGVLGFDVATKQLTLSVGSTFVFDGTSWRQAGGPDSPESRFEAGMGYDPQAQQLVLFGGLPNEAGAGILGTVLNDTWTWDGSSWIQRYPATSPHGGSDSLVYEPDSQQLILLEVYGLSLKSSGEVSMWSWRDDTWHELHPAALPAAGSLPQMTYDLAHHELILFEGIPGRMDGASQTWIYRGGTWERAA